MKFQDLEALSGASQTKEGYLVASVLAARSGIQDYAGAELGRPDLEVVKVYRPREAVFSRESLETFPNIPLTLDHPDTPVTAETYDAENVGNVSEVVPEGEAIRATITIMSKRAVDAVKAGKRELSVGYDADLDWTPGITQDGEAYDAIQKNIKANHLAIVDRARAGAEFRIGDSAKKRGVTPLTTAKTKGDIMSNGLRTVVVDGLQIKTTDEGATAITKLQKALESANTDAEEMMAGQEAEIADLKKMLETKNGEIAALMSQQDTYSNGSEAMSKMVRSRVIVIDKARKMGVAEEEMDDMSEEEIKRKAVEKKLGKKAAAAMSYEAICGAFAVLSKSAGMDRQSFEISSHDHLANPSAVAQANYHKRLTNSWKGDAK